jgi:hypothetical protein
MYYMEKAAVDASLETVTLRIFSLLTTGYDMDNEFINGAKGDG